MRLGFLGDAVYFLLHAFLHFQNIVQKHLMKKIPESFKKSKNLLHASNYLHGIYSVLDIINWRRKWQPTPLFLPGESQGRGSLVDCRLWGRTESDTTEAT